MKFLELELMEERHGHEEHVKLTETVLQQLNAEMDNLKHMRRCESVRGSGIGSLHSAA